MGRERGRLRAATLASAAVHIAVLAGGWVAATSAERLPHMQVFRVNVVSPPPNVAGRPEAAKPAAPSPAPAEPAPPPPEPTATRAPKPAVAAPEKPAPPKLQSKPAPPKPESKSKPEPAPSKPVPKTPAPSTSAAKTSSAAKKETGQALASGAKTAPKARSEPTPAAGEKPVASSPGGEGLNIRAAGISCPSEAYCNNIARQVKRYFRRPPEATSDRGDVCFRIASDGAVDGIEVQRLRGSVVFKLALIEAVEQAARAKEFGPLPKGFDADRLPVCVAFAPQR